MALIDSLVSYWALDEASGTRVDSHGSNDLTDNNTVGSTTGIISTAADFEASNSEYLSHADNADLSTGDIDFSFSFWVNAESFGSPWRIVAKGGANDLEYSLEGYGGAAYWRVTSGTGFANDTAVQATNAGTLSTATWYYIVVWHDSVNNQIGICVNDGTPNTASYSAGTYDSGAEFRIGTFPTYGGDWDGLIDEVGFWKKVLSSQERTDLYNSGAGLAYPFSAGGGVVVTPLRNRVMSPGHIFGGKCLC